MAKQANQLSSNLEYLTTVIIHSTYQQTMGKTIALVNGMASQILLFDIIAMLPSRAEYPQHTQFQPHNRQVGHLVTDCENTTQALRELIDRLKEEPNDSQDRLNRQNAVAIQSRIFIDTWTPLVVASMGSKGNPIQKDLNDMIITARKELDELTSIKAAAKSAAGNTVASVYSELFDVLAKSYEKSSAKWLYATLFIGFLIISVAAVFIYILFNTSIANNTVLIQFTIGKVVILSVLYFVLVMFSRNYKANLHLATVNKYRAKAMQSFEAFAEAAKDDQTKNAVLLEATRCIYSHVATGFVGADDQASGTHVVEILKAFGPAK